MNANAPARAEIDFEPARLSAFLTEALPGATGALAIERIGGGQSNPTYFIDAGKMRMVMRKRPPGEHARGAHDVGREYRIISALDGTPVPVPAPILYREEADVVGTPFYLMGRLDGRVFHDASLPDVPKGERRAYYRELARVLAALHAIDVDAVGLGGFRRPERFLVRLPPARTVPGPASAGPNGSWSARLICGHGNGAIWRRAIPTCPASSPGCARTCPRTSRPRSFTATTNSPT